MLPHGPLLPGQTGNLKDSNRLFVLPPPEYIIQPLFQVPQIFPVLYHSEYNEYRKEKEDQYFHEKFIHTF